MGEENQPRNFSNLFKKSKKIYHRVPLNERSYNRWGYVTNERVASSEDFTLDEINAIIRSGDLQSLRELSRYYYRTNSTYRNNIDFLAHLPLYEYLVFPIFDDEGSKVQILKTFKAACAFVDHLDLANILAHITTEWLLNGIYYGILREDGDKVTVQDLPIDYCRSRFKDLNNLNILEFNITYFEYIRDEIFRNEALATFPEEIQKAWRRWKENKKLVDPWISLPASAGGVTFSFITDQTPLLIASIPELKKLDDATGREEKRYENELYKILIQQMPIDSKGELVFQLEEIDDIHSAVADMLSDIDTVDVLTTLGDTKMENLQDSSAASQTTDRLAKYRKNAWGALGRGEILFNAENSSTLAYQIKKDESLMNGYLNAYETWIRFLLNERFTRKGLKFDFEILPITVFNRADLQQTYFRGAQFGYSKMAAGVAMGIRQTDQLSIMDLENDLLHMSEKMIPLQSSYTNSTNSQNNSENAQKSSNQTVVRDITNTGGRPELPDELKSEKTQANIASQG